MKGEILDIEKKIFSLEESTPKAEKKSGVYIWKIRNLKSEARDLEISIWKKESKERLEDENKEKAIRKELKEYTEDPIKLEEEYLELKTPTERERKLFKTDVKKELYTIKEKFIEDQKKIITSQKQEEELIDEEFNMYNVNSKDINEKLNNIESLGLLSFGNLEKLESLYWDNFKKSRSGNNTIEKIEEEIINNNIYVPSNGCCFFKALIFLCETQEEKSFITTLEQENYRTTYTRGISSKHSEIIIDLVYEKTKLQVFFENITEILDKNQKKKIHKKNVITMIENHYISYKYLENNTVQQLIQLEQKLNKTRENQEIIEEADIDEMIRFDDAETKKRKENPYKEPFTMCISGDIESYQEDKEVPCLIGYEYEIFEDNKQHPELKLKENIHSFMDDDNQKILINNFLKSIVKTFYTENKVLKGKLKRKIIIYFHNGRNYDYNLMFKEIDRNTYKFGKHPIIKGNSVLFNIIHIKSNIKMCFVDSCELCPYSLIKICNDYNLLNEKGDSAVIKHLKSYDDYLINKEQIEKYFFKDVLSLMEFVIILRNFLLREPYNVEILNCKTISQLAFKIYTENYNKEYYKQKWIFNNVELNLELGEYIQGGRSLPKERLFIENTSKEFLYYLDANSLYPTAMIEIENKCGGYFILDNKAKELNTSEIIELEQKLNSFCGKPNEKKYMKEFYLVDCDVEIPKSCIFPCVYMRYEDKTGYVCGSFKNEHLSSWELMELIMYNKAQIKIINAIKLITKVDMKLHNMMKELKCDRDKYKEDHNLVGSNIIKLIMNSVYGKFIEKPIFDEYKIINNTQKDKENYLIMEEVQLNEEDKLIHYKEYDLDHILNCSNPLIGIEILDMSKIIMNKFINKIDGFGTLNCSNVIYYTDTDSIIINKLEYTKLKHSIGNDLGMMKLEKKLKYFRSFGKKIYEYVDEHNEYDCRIKGVMIDRDPKNGDIEHEEETKQIFNSLESGDILTIKQQQFIRRIGSVSVEDNNKLLRPTYNLDSVLKENIYHSKYIKTL